MDEIEMRLAAVEMALVEVFAWVDPQALTDAQQSILGGLGNCTDQERAVRLGAVALIEDGRKRFAGPQIGVAIRRDTPSADPSS